METSAGSSEPLPSSTAADLPSNRFSTPTAAAAGNPFRSFWMGGFEGSDHINHAGVELNLARSSGHEEHLDEDYERAAAQGLLTVRESIGWRLTEPSPGTYDFSRVRRIAKAAQRHGIQVLWSFMHYGTPPDVSLLDDAVIERFARFAAAAARELGRWHRDALPPVYTLINEINFLAWAVSATRLIHPYSPLSERENTETSGYEVKRRLVRAVLAAMDAVRRVDARVRFLHIEPMVHVVAPPGRAELEPLAQEITAYQWQAWDMIAGLEEEDVSGYPEALDLVGVNFYHSGQWEVQTEERLSWHRRDGRRKPLSELLQDNWNRYRRPLILAETSHFGVGRAAWLSEVASQVRKARDAGVAVRGICLYPLVDRHDWNDPDHWHHSGLWDVLPGMPSSSNTPPQQSVHEKSFAQSARTAQPAERPFLRRLCTEYAASLSRWQAFLPETKQQGTVMTTLIVFSHLRWGYVYQRPQHLMSRLSRHYRVLFIEEPVLAPGPARFDCQPQSPTLDVLCPQTPIEAPGFHDDQLAVLKPLLSDYLRDNGIDDYIVWFYTPLPLPLITQLHPRAVIYDCMDELSAFKDAPRQLKQRETALFKLADVVLTGGPSLYEAKRQLHPNVHCLPSAVDTVHFSPTTLDEDSDMAHHAAQLMEPIGYPRLGFCGVIDERFDAVLLALVADSRPDWQFVMVGPVVKIDPTTLPQRPNIHWLSMQSYHCLPYLMAAWDVCLMPFAINESTRFISPTKTLEYLAAEKPVVSTPVTDVIGLYGDVVQIAHDPDEFLACCEAAINLSPTARERLTSQMLGVVFRSSWDSSVEAIQKLIQAELHKTPAAGTALREMGGLAQSSPDGEAAPIAPSVASRGRREVRHLIIGAGPTGLSAAYHLGEGDPDAETLMVEREERVGGWCRSIEQNGFTFDYAGHIMFSNDPHVQHLYDKLLGDNQRWQDREAWIYSKNTYTRYPFQGSLYGLPPDVLKECLVGAIEARFGPLSGEGLGADTNQPPANFKEFIYKVWGAGIAKHFAIPYNEKLWAVPLEEMETSWLGGRVPLPDLEQMIKGALEPTPKPMGPNARFGYPLRGGFQALMDAFLPFLRCELALNTSVLHVSPSKRTVRLDDGRTVRFDSLISTMPLPKLIEACGDEAPPDVRAAASALRHVSVRCVNLGVGRANITDKHWVYYPEDTVFHRIFMQGNASPHCNPSGGFGLICEITYGPSKPLPCEGAALVERVIEDCRRVGIISANDPIIASNQIDMPCAYVVYDHARAANVERIREWLAGFGVVLAGRYSEWEYYNSDHAFIAGKKAAEQAAAISAAAARAAQAGERRAAS